MMDYHLETYEDPSSFPDSDLFRALSCLPRERRDKVSRFVNMIDKKLCYLAYRLLRQGLSKHYNIPEGEYLRMGSCRNGKPILVDYPHIHFNISHCHQAVVCAFASEPIGVDVEGLIDFDDDLLLRVASELEAVVIKEAKDPSLAFTMLWTKKESYLKMSGVGLVDDLHPVLELSEGSGVRFESRYEPHHRYVLTLCMGGK